MRSIARDPHLHLAALAGTLLVSGCAAAPASSEPQPQVLAVEQVAGFWALSGPGGARCDVSLANLVIDGARPVLAERCGVSAAVNAKSWRATANGFEMLDASGRVTMAFRRLGEDAFEEMGGQFRLTRAPIS